MTTDHSAFLATILRGAGVTDHICATQLEYGLRNFPRIFEHIGMNEVVIASGSTTIQVESMSDITNNWDALHEHSSKEVHVYRMSKALWTGTLMSIRHAEGQAEIDDRQTSLPV